MRAFLCLSLLVLTAGCATSSGGPVFRLRPAPDPATGTPAKRFTGTAGVTVDTQSHDLGFSIVARPSSWYVAPEVGFTIASDSDRASEIFAGGRVAARLTELPIEVYVNGGYSYVDGIPSPAAPAPPVDDTSSSYYAGVGAQIFLGDQEGAFIGVGFRFVGHDDLSSEEESEAQLSIGWAW